MNQSSLSIFYFDWLSDCIQFRLNFRLHACLAKKLKLLVQKHVEIMAFKCLYFFPLQEKFKKRRRDFNTFSAGIENNQVG